MTRGEYTKAMVQYSNAIECWSKTKDSSDVSGALRYKRSIAAMRAGHHDLSISDALTSLVGRSDKDFQEGGRKFLYQAACAAYQKHNFPLGAKSARSAPEVSPDERASTCVERNCCKPDFVRKEMEITMFLACKITKCSLTMLASLI